MLGISVSNLCVNGFRGGIDADAKAIYNRIIAIPNGFSNLSRLNYFVKGLKAIYGTLSNVPVCYDAHWIGGVLGSGVGATAGQACARLCSLTVAGDAVQATASAQPLLLMHGGAASDNYWYSPRVTGNFVSSPNATVNQISGNIEIIVRYQSNTIGIIQTLLMKGNTTAYNYAVDISTTNNLRFIYGGFNVITSSQTINPLILQYYKVTRNSTTGDVQFFTSIDGVTYTQLGTTQSSTVGNLPTNTVQLVVGDNTAFTGNASQGNIYRVTISNTIGGAPVVDFNPAQYNASISQTAWTSSTGEVWTINTGTATTGYKGVICDRIIVMFDGVDDNIKNATVPRGNICSQYLVYKTENEPGSGVTILDSASANYQNSFAPEASNMKLYMNGTLSGLTKTLGTTLSLFTATNNQGVLNTLQKNNDTEVSNSYTPTLSGTGITIGKLALSSFYQKGNVHTYICNIGVDTTTTRTAMYNFIRSLNNNAF